MDFVITCYWTRQVRLLRNPKSEFFDILILGEILDRYLYNIEPDGLH
jgi:hypothetical protein